MYRFSPQQIGVDGGVADIGHGVDVFGRHRLFEPHQPERLERDLATFFPVVAS